MIREIAPHVSCVCTEDQFVEAQGMNYQEIYVITEKGFFRYMKLRHAGRFICQQVQEIPGAQSNLSSIMQFLPNNGEKIPFQIFKTIVAFFLEVMRVKNSEVEAHVHILWNPDTGYSLAIPKQRVSKASVSYDFEHIGPNDVIIADFHSHNTMGTAVT